jgi:hypothetical protein
VTAGIVIPDLPAFRAALKASENGSTSELVAAMKDAGAPIAKRAGELSPHGPTGRLRGSYYPKVSGTKGQILSRVPYGPGAEWGARGKWSGFGRYGVRGSRFATLALEQKADEAAEIITERLNDILTIHGWAT